jgi:hypothetical protein
VNGAYLHRGEFSGRLPRPRLLAAFAGGFAALAGIGIAIAALVAPSPAEPLCKPYEPCGKPLVLSKPLVNEQSWRSSALGFELQHPSYLTVEDQSPTEVWLSAGGAGELHVRGTPTTNESPRALLDDELSFLQNNLLSFSRNTNLADQLLGTNVGLRPGPGGIYDGTIATPQGAQEQLAVAVMASGDGKVSIVTTVLADPQDKEAVFDAAGNVFKSVEWASDLRVSARIKDRAK